MLCFAVSDITMVHKMADEYILEMPKISIPDCSPEWVSTFFPALIKSIYDSYNGTIRKMVMDFNASFIEMEQEIHLSGDIWLYSHLTRALCNLN